jgi:hypothetical protein
MHTTNVIKSRASAVIILLLVVAFGGAAISSTIAGLFSNQRDRIENSLRQLAGYRAQTATKSRLEERLKEIERLAQSLPGLVKAENSSVAAAQLQGAINAIVQQHRGEVRTSQVLPAEAVKGFERILVRNELSVPITELRDIIHGIETHDPYMFIERALIAGPRDWSTDGKGAAEPSLVINWTVYAFRRRGPT